MDKGKRRWLMAFIGTLLVAAIFLALGKSGRLVDMYQVSERDGHRQLEYKILGVIPYEKQVVSPETRVTEDYWRQMAKTGIKIGPEVDRKKKGMYVSRTVRPHETSYWLRTNVKGDHAALVAKYASQVPSPEPYMPTWTYHTPFTSKGPKISILIDLQKKGIKPGEDLCDLGIGVTVPK